MDCRFLIQLCILNIRVKTTRRVYAEDVHKAGIVVKRIAVDVIGRLRTRQDEDSSGLRVCVVSFRWLLINIYDPNLGALGVSYDDHPLEEMHDDISLLHSGQ